MRKDKKGYINIPGDTYFWAVVLKDTINILSSRKNQLFHTIDALNIEFIKPIPETHKLSGGVKDFGKFNEGYCFQVVTIVPTQFYEMNIDSSSPKVGSQEIWVFCTDTPEMKHKFMSLIVGLKLKKQHQFGHYLDSKEALRREKLENKIKQGENNSMNIKETGGNSPTNPRGPVNGYFVLLQDWTQCTLKCGGGLQYRQLMCIKPKNGGKPCEGPSVRTRPCNTQPCPQIKNLNIKPVITKKDDVLKPIVKAMRISMRPLRYDKCNLKETDVLISKISKEASEKGFEGLIERMPARLVMNNKTLTVFKDDHYSDIIITFLLSDTKFVRIESRKDCFDLQGNNKAIEVCEIPGTKSFVEEWDYDFNLFKYQCKTDRPEITLNPSEEKKLEHDFKEKIAEAKIDVVRQRQQALKKAVETNDESQLEKKVQKTESITMQAVKKELFLEEKIEREEKEREEMETIELQKQVEIEKKKNECLNNIIKQKEIEDQFNLAKEETEKEIENLKTEAKKDIQIKRFSMKQKILTMRKKNERKKNKLKQELMTVRTEMVDKIGKITKQGSDAICETTKNDITKINYYCENNFFDNYYKLSDCKDKDNFCYICCENEFGDVYIAERDKCYNICEAKPKAQVILQKGRTYDCQD